MILNINREYIICVGLVTIYFKYFISQVDIIVKVLFILLLQIKTRKNYKIHLKTSQTNSLDIYKFDFNTSLKKLIF